MTQPIKINFAPDFSYTFSDLKDFDSEMAYIKKETINNEPVWSIYSGQGEQMGYAASREVAFAIVLQNELTAYSVH